MLHTTLAVVCRLCYLVPNLRAVADTEGDTAANHFTMAKQIASLATTITEVYSAHIPRN